MNAKTEIGTVGLRERKKQLTRDKLLDIAERAFAASDFDDVSVDDIAAEAMISQKTFFNYFPSKASLLEELLRGWLEEVNAWPVDTPLEGTPESAIVPPNMDEIIDWVVSHRRILKMILLHTKMFDSVFHCEGGVSFETQIFPEEYRQPRIERIRLAQQKGIVRDDLSAQMICHFYDYIRLDMVKRWVCLPDEVATREVYRQSYWDSISLITKGLAP